MGHRQLTIPDSFLPQPQATQAHLPTITTRDMPHSVLQKLSRLMWGPKTTLPPHSTQRASGSPMARAGPTAATDPPRQRHRHMAQEPVGPPSPGPPSLCVPCTGTTALGWEGDDRASPGVWTDSVSAVAEWRTFGGWVNPQRGTARHPAQWPCAVHPPAAPPRSLQAGGKVGLRISWAGKSWCGEKLGTSEILKYSPPATA